MTADTRPSPDVREGTAARRAFLLFAALAAQPGAAIADDWTATVAVSSQLVDRGIPVSAPGPVAQGAVNAFTSSGWSFGASVSYQTQPIGRFSEALLQGAKAWRIDDDWQVQATALYYRYPNNPAWRAFERVELGGTVIFRDVLTVGLSAAERLHGGGSPRAALDVGLRWPLTDHLSLAAGAGVARYLVAPYHYYDGRRYGTGSGHYTYGNAGLAWSDGAWRVELLRVTANRDRRPFEREASPWLATVARSF